MDINTLVSDLVSTLLPGLFDLLINNCPLRLDMIWVSERKFLENKKSRHHNMY